MHHKQIALALLAATAFVAAAEIEREDVPPECRAICEPVIQISEACDDNDDQGEQSCHCAPANGPAFETCNECTLQYPGYFSDDDNDGDDNDDNEVNVWFNRCAFGNVGSTATSTPTITTAPTVAPPAATGVYTTIICGNDGNDGDDGDDTDDGPGPDTDDGDDTDDGPDGPDTDDGDDTDDNDGACVTRVVTGVAPVVAPVTTTNAQGSTFVSSVTTAPSVTQGTPTTFGTQSTPAGTGTASTFDGGAMATSVPMVGAAGMVLAALLI